MLSAVDSCAARPRHADSEHRVHSFLCRWADRNTLVRTRAAGERIVWRDGPFTRVASERVYELWHRCNLDACGLRVDRHLDAVAHCELRAALRPIPWAAPIIRLAAVARRQVLERGRRPHGRSWRRCNAMHIACGDKARESLDGAFTDERRVICGRIEGEDPNRLGRGLRREEHDIGLVGQDLRIVRHRVAPRAVDQLHQRSAHAGRAANLCAIRRVVGDVDCDRLGRLCARERWRRDVHVVRRPLVDQLFNHKVNPEGGPILLAQLVGIPGVARPHHAPVARAQIIDDLGAHEVGRRRRWHWRAVRRRRRLAGWRRGLSAARAKVARRIFSGARFAGGRLAGWAREIASCLVAAVLDCGGYVCEQQQQRSQSNHELARHESDALSAPSYRALVKFSAHAALALRHTTHPAPFQTSLTAARTLSQHTPQFCDPTTTWFSTCNRSAR